MKKITLILFAVCVVSLTYAQTINVIGYPTEVALDTGTDYMPSVGQNPYVIVCTDMPADLPVWSPTIPLAQYDFPDGTIMANGETPSRNGAGNIGTSTGMHNFIPAPGGVAASNRVIDVSSNTDGTVNYTLIATKWSFANTPDSGPYSTHFRYFAPVGKYFTSVALKSGSTTEYEIVGFTYNSSATAETEANLIAKANTLLDAYKLSTNDFSKDKLEAYYNAGRDAVVLSNEIEGGYSIFNIMGQKMISGEIESREIDVETLKSGLYILATEKGSLKFVK
ncbi:MAG: hypothetical protein ACON5F_06675 [Jejuia sp.]